MAPQSRAILHDRSRSPRRAVLLFALALIVIACSLPPTAHAEAGTVAVPSRSAGLGALRATLRRPSVDGRAPAVVLMHGCTGWQPAVYRALESYARDLQKAGYVALNLDSFGPRGLTGSSVCDSVDRLAAARDYRAADAFDALAFLRAQPFVDAERVFLIGQSNGGSVAMIAATAPGRARYGRQGAGFRGVVALYPWCGAVETKAPHLVSPLLVLGGGLDDWVPPQDCASLAPRGASMRVKIYPEAAHSFDIPVSTRRYLGKRIGYDPAAASDARREILAFLAANS